MNSWYAAPWLHLLKPGTPNTAERTALIFLPTAITRMASLDSSGGVSLTAAGFGFPHLQPRPFL